MKPITTHEIDAAADRMLEQFGDQAVQACEATLHRATNRRFRRVMKQVRRAIITAAKTRSKTRSSQTSPVA